jgi:DNA-binding winged helix-turn-helix (wHTH) protein/TolB-like protein/Tfp pilus assembly protein PilF
MNRRNAAEGLPNRASAAADADVSVLRFDGMEFDLLRGELRGRNGAPIVLRPKAELLLRAFLYAPGRLLAREELMDVVWPSTVVTDDSLVQCVGELRAALGDRSQQLIRTVPRRGYRFDAKVERVDAPATIAATLDVEASSPVPATAAAPPAAERARWPRWLAASGAGALLLMVGAASVGVLHTRGGIDAELASRRSLAVMPFADLGEPASPYLAEGITQEILTDLGRLPDALIVAGGAPVPGARTVAGDVRRYGREFGVQHVLLGSARRDGERIEVIVQMARTDNGALLWSERFDYDHPTDWNWVRDVSRRVAASLDLKLGEAALDAVHRDARNGTAIDEWMRGAYLMRRVGSRDDLLEARRHFEAAVAADPQSVNALAGLAGTHLSEVVHRWSPGRLESIAAARELASRAIARDPNHELALSILGGAAAFGGEFDTALDYYRRELQRNPSSYHAHRDMASLMYFMVRLDEVQPHAEMALRLGPMDPENVAISYSILGFSQMLRGRDEEAYRSLRLSVEATRSFPGPRLGLIAAAALSGRTEEAHRLAAEFMRERPDLTIAGLWRAGLINSAAFSAAHARYKEGLRLAGVPEGTPTLAAASAPEPNSK